MRIKRYINFIEEKLDTKGTYLQKGDSKYAQSEVPIHKKRFGNVFKDAKSTDGIDFELDFIQYSDSYRVIFPDDFTKHFEKRLPKDIKESEKASWINKLKKDLTSSQIIIQTEGPENFNRTHFASGIPVELRGLSLGYIIYEGLIKHLGYASSKSNASEKAQRVWSKIAEDPDFLGVISNNTNSILVVYKNFKGDLDRPLGEVIIDFIEANKERLTIEEFSDRYEDLSKFKGEEALNRFLELENSLNIDPQIFIEFPDVKNYLINYTQRIENLNKAKDIDKKINTFREDLRKEFNQNPSKAKQYFLSVTDESKELENNLRILDRSFEFTTLEQEYLILIKRSINRQTNNLKNLFDIERAYRSNTYEAAFQNVEQVYKSETKEQEQNILDNLPQLSDKLSKELNKFLKENSPTKYYKNCKFIYLKNKLKYDKSVIDNIDSFVDEYQDIKEFNLEFRTKVPYEMSDLTKSLYPDYKELLPEIKITTIDYGSMINITVDEFFKNQLKISKVEDDVKLFDDAYKRLYKEFEIGGYKKAKELYEKEFKSQFTGMNYTLTPDFTWCQNTLMKYFKTKGEGVKRKPTEALELLLSIMEKIEFDKKKSIEKKAYKKFTNELEKAFKEGGYVAAQDYYDKEIQNISKLLDIQFFDSPSYGTSVKPTQSVSLTGKEHLEKRLELYKKLGTFPKIEVPKPIVKEEPIDAGIERPKDIEKPEQRTFIQRFRDFIGI